MCSVMLVCGSTLRTIFVWNMYVGSDIDCCNTIARLSTSLHNLRIHITAGIGISVLRQLRPQAPVIEKMERGERTKQRGEKSR